MKVKITAIRQTVYTDLMAKYENPIEHTCDVREGQEWISIDGKRPEGLCPSAWESMRPFVESLARGEGNFYDGWMKNPMSAMISCNDGFRPFSFYITLLEEEAVVFASPTCADSQSVRFGLPVRRVRTDLSTFPLPAGFIFLHLEAAEKIVLRKGSK